MLINSNKTGSALCERVHASRNSHPRVCSRSFSLFVGWRWLALFALHVGDFFKHTSLTKYFYYNFLLFYLIMFISTATPARIMKCQWMWMTWKKKNNNNNIEWAKYNEKKIMWKTIRQTYCFSSLFEPLCVNYKNCHGNVHTHRIVLCVADGVDDVLTACIPTILFVGFACHTLHAVPLTKDNNHRQTLERWRRGLSKKVFFLNATKLKFSISFRSCLLSSVYL